MAHNLLVNANKKFTNFSYVKCGIMFSSYISCKQVYMLRDFLVAKIATCKKLSSTLRHQNLVNDGNNQTEVYMVNCVINCCSQTLWLQRGQTLIRGNRKEVFLLGTYQISN